jgi:hypothetical protein
MISRFAVRPDDILQALNEVRPHVVHFSGHGSQSDGIILEDDNGNAVPVPDDAFASVFRVMADNIRLVIFNSCFSMCQAQAVAASIDCAIGTTSAIDDVDAITFAASVYRGIGFGCSVQEAYDQGVTSLRLHDGPKDITRLIVRKGVNASDVVLLGPRSQTGRPLDIGRDNVGIQRFYEGPDVS